ncbi:MAG: hypothetical protein B6D36_14450 [Planctomycetes bacterium UTPLA1]|nr:MAG: hypothetical protein B6D36_14450 [Planctomycetes bacterium UTPLA1]
MAQDSAGRSMPCCGPRRADVVGRYAPVHLLSEAWQNPLSGGGDNFSAEIAPLTLRPKSAASILRRARKSNSDAQTLRD